MLPGGVEESPEEIAETDEGQELLVGPAADLREGVRHLGRGVRFQPEDGRRGAQDEEVTLVGLHGITRVLQTGATQSAEEGNTAQCAGGEEPQWHPARQPLPLACPDHPPRPNASTVNVLG